LTKIDSVGTETARRENVKEQVVVARGFENQKLRAETYLNSLMLLPAQVIRGARQRVFRLLTYRPSVDLLFTMHDHVAMPLRC